MSVMLKGWWFFVHVCICSAKRDTTVMRVLEDSFIAARIVPHYIPRAPYSLAKVKFQGGDVSLESLLPVEQAVDPPQVTWDTCNEHYYVLVMIGPPFPGKPGNLRHWLVVNIPGTEVDKGDVLAAYLPPTPPPETGPNHYVLLVYEQPSYLHFEDPPILDTTILSLPMRAGFVSYEFADKYQLGNPVAGTFFDCTTTLESIII